MIGLVLLLASLFCSAVYFVMTFSGNRGTALGLLYEMWIGLAVLLGLIGIVLVRLGY